MSAPFSGIRKVGHMWHVFIQGNFISDHSTRTGAVTSYNQVANELAREDAIANGSWETGQ